MKYRIIILYFLVALLLTACDGFYVEPLATQEITISPTKTLTNTPTLQKSTEYSSNIKNQCKIIDLYGDHNTTVNLHSKGGMQYPVIGVARTGEIYIIKNTQNNWIETENGWIYKDWCAVKK